MQRQVKDRKTKADAETLAKEIKRQLKRGEVGRVHRVTTDEQQLLEICRKLRDPKAILEEALRKQEDFKRATVAECCDRYIAEYEERDSSMTRKDATSKAGVSRDWVAELAGNSPGIIRTNYKRPLPEKVGKEWFTINTVYKFHTKSTFR